MSKERKLLILAAIILLVATSLGISGATKGRQNAEEQKKLQAIIDTRLANKAKLFLKAPKIDGITNKKVILVNFWTSVSSNSLRVIPHLNAWYDKYKEKGLEIVGVHTPEFDFENDAARLASTTNALGIKYPVVQDNDYKIWANYQNGNWPKIYLIDADGFIVYNHIGEGSYDSIEKRIQGLLDEKNKIEGINAAAITETMELEPGNSELIEFPGTPSLHFGSDRNILLGNGATSTPGIQTFKIPKKIERNKLYLTGKWNIQKQYAENIDPKAKMTFKYTAKEVYLVGGSKQPIDLTITQDGTPITSEIGEDGLYLIGTNTASSEHTLELTIGKPGLKVYVIEFR